MTVVLDDPDGLRTTLQSIDRPSQAFPEVSLLIMDGGSRRETLEVGKAFLTRRLDALHSSSDLGPYDAMNRALGLISDSDLVWFVNAGDYLIDKEVLSDVIQWTADADFVWGYGPVAIVESDGSVRSVPNQLPYTLLNHAMGKTPICHQTVVARAGALRSAGGFDLRFSIAADFKLLLQLGQRWKPRVWPRPIVAYRAGGLSDRNIFETRRQQILARRETLPLRGKPALEAKFADLRRLGRLGMGRGLDWLAVHRMFPGDWRRRAAAVKRNPGLHLGA